MSEKCNLLPDEKMLHFLPNYFFAAEKSEDRSVYKPLLSLGLSADVFCTPNVTPV